MKVFNEPYDFNHFRGLVLPWIATPWTVLRAIRPGTLLRFPVGTDYILSVPYLSYGLGGTTSTRLSLRPSRGLVVERFPIRGFAADYRFLSRT